MINLIKFYHNFILILIFLLFTYNINALAVKDTKISSSRNSNRQNICGYYSATYTSQQRQKSKTSVKQFTYMSDQDIQKLLFQKNYLSPSGLTIVITLPHLISLAVLIILIFPLFCCCVWPQKYPICKKWRKPQKQMYNKCQLKWPSYASLMLYLVVAVGALIALIQAPDLIKRYNDVGCKYSGVFDDLLYGRLSNEVEGRFFVGLQPLKNQLNIFNASKLATFFSDSTNALSTATQVRAKQNIFQSTVQSIYTNYVDSIYTNAFSADGTAYYPVNSAFKTMYMGPSSDSSKILGNIKSTLTIVFNQVNTALDHMILAFSGLSTKTQTGVSNQITSISSSITTLTSQFEVYMNEIGTNFYNNNLYDQLYMLLTVFYGVVFGFAILGFIGNILLTFCTVVRTRLIMYFACGFLTFFALVGFCFLVFLAFMHPQMNQICAYADRKLPFGASTKNVILNMGYPNLADKISDCLSDGNGNVLNTMNPSFSSSFDNINVISQGTLKFNDLVPDFNSQVIDKPFTDSSSIITKVKNAQVWDLNDTVAIKHIDKVVTKSYTVAVACNSLNVNGDVWMPSFYLYTCPAGKSKMSACADLSVLTTCPVGCYEILNEFVSPSGDHSYIANLATRYNSNACNYYNYITKLHDNWNIVRQNKMISVYSSLNSLKITVDDYASRTNLVKAGLDSFKTTLQTNIDSMTNLTSGSFNGMNCKVIGESIWDLRDSYCIGLLNSVTYNIISLCLICYGTLLLVCCVTCAGSRHFKHLQKMQMHVGYKGTPISLSDTRLIDK